MTFEEYQKEAVSFRSETANNEEYLTLGLIEEVGEAAGKLAKRRRDGVWDEKAFIKELGDILWFVANLADYCDKYNDTNLSVGLKECFNQAPFAVLFGNTYQMIKIADYAVGAVKVGSDCFINLIGVVCDLANCYGYTLEQVAEINLAKLRDRAARGQIHGDGDER
mgnify:CR=1 FL=1